MKKALCLVSSGIDSPVAASIMMDKLEVSFVYFDNQYSKKDHIQRKKVLKQIQTLSNLHNKKLRLFIVDHETSQIEFKANANTRFQCIFCKRTMYRVSERIAKENKIDYLLTGENLGQVASQTLNNLITQDKTVSLEILRPLLTFDKNDIIKIARKIETYETSIEKDIPCPYLPHNPITRSKPRQLEFEETRFDIEKLLKNSFETKETMIIEPIK